MVIVQLNRYYDIDRYFSDLSGDGLVQNWDYVYNILPTEVDAIGVRVGFQFLDDRLSSFYGLKWAC